MAATLRRSERTRMAQHRRPPPSSKPTRTIGATCSRLLGVLFLLPMVAASTSFANRSSLADALVEWCGNAASAEVAHGHISTWDTGVVTSMDSLVNNAPCRSTFNEPIGSWDVSSVTNMDSMFYVSPGRCPIPPAARASAPLRSWQGASDFNQPLEWDVASVTSMFSMFNVSPGRCPIPPAARASAPLRTWQRASRFNQPLEWDVASVTSMVLMFNVSRAAAPSRLQRAPQHPSAPGRVCLRLQPTPGVGRRECHEHGRNVRCKPGPLPHPACSAPQHPSAPVAVCQTLQPALGVGRRECQRDGRNVRCKPGPLPHPACSARLSTPPHLAGCRQL